MRKHVMLIALSLFLCQTQVLLSWQDRITVQLGSAAVDFVRLPPSDSAGLETNGYSIVSTYMAETELSFAALKALIGDADYQVYLGIIAANVSQEDESGRELLELARQASPEVAAPLLSLTEIVPAAKQLESSLAKSLSYDATIEQLIVRLPTRSEWQHAAMDGDPELRVFAKWPDVAVAKKNDKINYLYQDLRTAKTNIEDEVLADPNELIKVSDELFSSTQGNKLGFDLISEILASPEGLGFDLRYTKESQLDRPLLSEVKTNLGFHHLHGNLSEWVIFGCPDQDLAFKFWESLGDESSDSEPRFLAMGGSTFYVNSAVKSYRAFELNGGEPYDATSGELKPLNVVDMYNQGNVLSAGADSSSAGCRLVVVRTLRKDWFVAFRRQFLNSVRSAESLGELGKTYKEKIGSLLTVEKAKIPGELVDRYVSLSCLSEEGVDLLAVLETGGQIESESDGRLGGRAGGVSNPKLEADIANLVAMARRNRVAAAGEPESPQSSTPNSEPVADSFFEIYAELVSSH